jgi:myb proto-oncogene protein
MDGQYPINKPGTSDELLSFPCGEDNPSSDFMMDFNMGDICLSDLLNSNFSDMCDFNYGDDNCNDLSPSSREQLMLSEEMLQDWSSTASNAVELETNAAPNLQYSFASPLGYGEQWLGE